MKRTFGLRQVRTLLLLTIVLGLVFGVLEITNVVRLATQRAAVVSALITNMASNMIVDDAAAHPEDPIAAVRADPRLQRVLQSALAHAPSILYAAVCSPSGIVLAHSFPEEVGTEIESFPPLPRPHSFLEALRVLGDFRKSSPVYEVATVLDQGEEEFVSIRVLFSGALVKGEVMGAVRRGLVAAAVVILLALGLGILVGRATTRRVRMLEEGVAALREGRFDTPLPESGVDMFGRLAHQLNLLGEQFQHERQDRDPGHADFKEAADLLGDGIVTLGPRGKILLLNGPAARLLSIEASTCQGRLLSEVLVEDHPLLQLSQRLIESRDRTLSILLPAAGEDRYVAVGHRIAGLEGNARGLLIEIKRQSEQENIHSLVDQTRVLSWLGRMASGVAHEIRNPLTPLKLAVSALDQWREMDPEEVIEQIRTAKVQVSRIERAVTGFLSVVQLKPLSNEWIDLGELIRETCAGLEIEANLNGIELEASVAPDLPRVNGDPQVLRQALENLIKNGYQATPSRTGRVVVRARTDVDGESILLSVTDNGPGIPEEIRKRVFDFNFTTKSGGTGVGLALVLRAVELHGGRIELDSDVSRGTTFTLRLPSVRAAAVAGSER